MKTIFKATAIALCLATAAGCSTNPETGEREFNRTAIGATVGGVAGGLLGAAIGGDKGALLGIAAGAALGGGTGYWMDSKAKKLQADLKRQGMEAKASVDPMTGRQMLIIQAPSDVAFATSSADLQPAAFQGLSAIAASVKSQPELRLEVTGHTDSSGGQQLNNVLSYARAQAVAQYLYASGVSAQSIAIRGVGPSMPIASDATAQGRAKNRRVEIQIKQG